MPSNHCSNWEYHEWLKNKNTSTIEGGLFWCEINDKENYYIGLIVMSAVGIQSPYCTLKVNGYDFLLAQEDGRMLRTLINKIKKMKPEINEVIDLTNGIDAI